MAIKNENVAHFALPLPSHNRLNRKQASMLAFIVYV